MLDVLWENISTPKEEATYKILFLPLKGAHGAVKYQKRICGRDQLLAYLKSLVDKAMAAERKEQSVNQWLKDVHSSGYLSLPVVLMTEEQLLDLSNE